MAFVQRQLSFTFALGSGTYGDSGATSLTVSGCRATVHVINAGTPSFAEVQAQVFGLTLDQMNQLTSIWSCPSIGRNNVLTVYAGDSSVPNPALCYQGQIQTCFADFNSAPECFLSVMARTAYIESLQPANPTSYKGSVNVATIIGTLAGQMGLIFENNGASVMLATPYYPGTLMEQARQAAAHAGILMTVDNGTLAIWPQGGCRPGTVPLISAATGMVGYPAISGGTYVGVTTLYNPDIAFGQSVQVQSIITPACGTYMVMGIEHDLQSATPGGRWFTHLQLFPLGLPT